MIGGWLALALIVYLSPTTAGLLQLGVLLLALAAVHVPFR